MLGGRDAEIDGLKERVASLSDQLARLESAAKDVEANRLGDENQTELATLRTEMQQKNCNLAQRQAEAEILTQRYRGQIRELETDLAAQRALTAKRCAEPETAPSETGRLREHLMRLEAVTQQAEWFAAGRVDPILPGSDSQPAASSEPKARDQHTRQGAFSESGAREIPPAESRITEEKKNGTTNL